MKLITKIGIAFPNLTGASALVDGDSSTAATKNSTTPTHCSHVIGSSKKKMPATVGMMMPPPSEHRVHSTKGAFRSAASAVNSSVAKPQPVMAAQISVGTVKPLVPANNR